MSEILFRGKRKDNGEWIYGYYIKLNNKHYIFVDNHLISDDCFIWKVYNEICFNSLIKEVIPNTIGYYTGRNDKNDKNIFKGDIVKFRLSYSKGYGKPEIIEFIGIISYNRFYNSCIFIKKWKYLTNDENNYYFLNKEFHIENAITGEIIGNIYENPELLEEK